MNDNRLDLEDGWINQQVVRNVFQHTLRRLDEIIPDSRALPIKDVVTELFESAKYALLKQRKTVHDITGKSSVDLQGEAMPSQKDSHDRRVQTIRARQV